MAIECSPDMSMNKMKLYHFIYASQAWIKQKRCTAIIGQEKEKPA